MKSRNPMLDILKILAMLMVVLLHLLLQGGFLNAASFSSAQYWFGWLLEALSVCAVNVFTFITGYISWDSQPKPKRIIETWIRVLFYSLIGGALLALMNPSAINLKTILQILFPVSSSSYWYVTSYIALCLVMPFLNIVVCKIAKKQLHVIVGTMVLVGCNPLALAWDPFVFSGGYSVAWLSVVYLCGGYFSKYGCFSRLSSSGWLLVYLGATACTLASKAAIELFSTAILGSYMVGGILFNYQSPTVLLAAIGLSGAFIQFQYFPSVKMQIIIRWLMKANLSVYIIHCTPVVWSILIMGCTANLASSSVPTLIAVFPLGAIGVYAACVAIDLIRIKLFEAMKIEERINRASDSINNMINHN